MKTTYITSMPDQVGAFLQAGRIIAAHDANIVRVSYNRAVDTHMLFIEVEGSRDSLRAITAALREIGYLVDQPVEKRPMLINMRLPDRAGMLLPVLEVLDRSQINISYMSSEADGSGWQDYRMAMQIDDPALTKRLLDEISALCEVRVLDYDPTEKILDNTVFYLSFSNEMGRLLHLDAAQTSSFIVNANLIMQMLDERGEAPYKTFEYIRRFALFIAKYKGDAYRPTVKTRALSDRVTVTAIEPPCGSNTFVLECDGELLLVDGGFPCYRDELHTLLCELYDGFDARVKTMALTHADIDHIGLAPLVDRVLGNADIRQNFVLESEHKPDWREQTRYNAPYCRLSKLIAGYTPFAPERVEVIGQKVDDAPLSYIGDVHFGDLDFAAYQGNGGHVRGETVLVCRERRLAFTGDNLVNIRGFSREQAAFNRLAPYLMTSVNVDSEKATIIRKELEQRLHGYTIFPGHGDLFVNE